MATKPNQAKIYKAVPAFLCEMRGRASLTQRELAKRIGRSQWWVHRNKTGSRRVDVAEFVLICRGCGIEPAAALKQLDDVYSGF